MDKPLFIPLKTEYYEAFERGDKTTEYRIYGRRWNERSVKAGRKVILSKGYGKKHRLTGVVSTVEARNSWYLPIPTQLALKEIYGKEKMMVLCIGIADIKSPEGDPS